MDRYPDQFRCTVSGDTKADRDARAQAEAERYYGGQRFRLVEVQPSEKIHAQGLAKPTYETVYLFSDDD